MTQIAPTVVVLQRTRQGDLMVVVWILAQKHNLNIAVDMAPVSDPKAQDFDVEWRDLVDVAHIDEGVRKF
jgi:hypothetical protein